MLAEVVAVVAVAAGGAVWRRWDFWKMGRMRVVLGFLMIVECRVEVGDGEDTDGCLVLMWLVMAAWLTMFGFSH